MSKFLIRRTLHAGAVLFGVSIIVFTLFHLLPGGPARAVIGPRATPVAIHQFDLQYGLLNPLPVQYWDWLIQVLRGNLGYSYKLDQSVDSLIGEALPRTLVLAGVATVLALVIAIPVGIWQAARRNRVDDYALTTITFVFYSMPTFLMGIILIVVFSSAIPLFPSTGPTGTAPLTSQLNRLVLPVVTLTLVTVGLFSRYMRSSAVDSLLQDYIRTARAKGASRLQVLRRHVFRNSLLPVITLIGLSLPGIVAGAVVTESLFDYPGMGYLFWNAAQTDDFPVLIGTSMVIGVAVVVGSLVADILYAVADPRVRRA